MVTEPNLNLKQKFHNLIKNVQLSCCNHRESYIALIFCQKWNLENLNSLWYHKRFYGSRYGFHRIFEVPERKRKKISGSGWLLMIN